MHQSSAHESESVKEFFDQWHIYQKAVEHNYLRHRETCAAVGASVCRVGKPFSFLDLGSGDACWTSQILASQPVSRYQAVDLSAIALDLAKKNLEALSCPKEFIQADYFPYVAAHSDETDFVFIGRSLHHLLLPEKREFFRSVASFVPTDGRLVLSEPIRRQGEGRQEWLDRWWADTLATWKEMTPEELEKCHAHVCSSDYPETVEDYSNAARSGGFTRIELLYQDPEKFYAVIECLK